MTSSTSIPDHPLPLTTAPRRSAERQHWNADLLFASVNGMKLEQITVWRDEAYREASLEMALDHALLEHSIREGAAIARFYAWNAPAITVGYFHKEKEGAQKDTDTIRRYTGGGLVEHGEDVTFALTFPPRSTPATSPGAERYRWIHTELAGALRLSGLKTVLHGEPFQHGERPCFEHAVSEDLIDPETGNKICGGAQRRSKGAVIHQGSVRLPLSLREVNAPWTGDFLDALSATQRPIDESEKTKLIARAIEIQSECYGTTGWNRRSGAKMKIKF